MFDLVNGGCCDDDALQNADTAVGWARKHVGPLDGRGYNQLVATRDALRSVIHALRAAGTPSAADLDELSRALDAVPARHSVVADDRGVHVQVERPVRTLGELRSMVAEAALGLLVGADTSRLRSCSGCDCVFYDESKNRSRTWCDMRRCGNRAKVAAYAARARA